ncbi:MAG: LLM class flavin-dependent oxidoreductase [Acidimicrobiia bacterium]|nr:LLM class flavin-dependent oxidoreductase [Acidimicrobiia bacterium]MYC43999.1 LLM class flavin-dependent oxidoreductase [Acidimicrobiia bacterium]MYI20532.1 LLM class flavin-dependent oxidoreductase [Acidimicrobiia bacterium]
MQFFMFHLMPYPYLPEDFDERESAWVTLPNTTYDPTVGTGLYNRYLDELEYAEQLGFDGICVNEHHQNAYGTMPSPNLMAAALVRRTERLKLAIVGNGLPLRDHPLRVAEEVAMLDVISGGRIISGFVRGIGDEYFSMSIDPSTSRERYSEAHDLIIKAWTTEGPFRWIGKHYRLNYVNVWPRPLQQPHPPIWIPAFGSTETMTWAAERHYTYLSVFAPSKLLKRWFDGYRAGANAAGYEAPRDKIGILLPIYVAETEKEAHAEGRQYVTWLYHKGLKHKFEHLFPPGYMTDHSWGRFLQSGLGAYSDVSYEDLVKQGYAVVGSPATVRERLAELAEELGFGLVNALLHIGDMPHDHTIRNMELFAREVMPHFRTQSAAA